MSQATITEAIVNSNTGIDRNALYGDFQASAVNRSVWRDNLAKRAAHKALNIPLEDDVNIDASVTNNHYYPPTPPPPPTTATPTQPPIAAQPTPVVPVTMPVPQQPGINVPVRAFDVVTKRVRPDGTVTEVSRRRATPAEVAAEIVRRNQQQKGS